MTFQTYTPQEVADRLGLTKQVVLTMIREGKIRASKISRKVIRINERDLYRLMDETRIEIIGKQLYN